MKAPTAGGNCGGEIAEVPAGDWFVGQVEGCGIEGEAGVQGGREEVGGRPKGSSGMGW